MRLVIAVVMGLGCSAESGKDPSYCEPLKGTYVVSFAQRAGGTCGRITDLVITIDRNAKPEAGCTVKTGSSATGCSTKVEQECSDGRHAVLVCKIAPDGDSAQCISTFFGSDCTSTYDVAYKRP